MAPLNTLRGIFCAVGLATCCGAAAGDLSQADRDFDVDFEADEVLALNLSTAGRAAARGLRFRIGAPKALRNLRLWITPLRAPPGINARAAVERLRKADPEGVYSVNESYALAGSTPGATPCDVERCYGPRLVGWAGACGGKIRIGMVDSAIDMRAPNLRDRQVTVKRFSAGSASGVERAHGSGVAALLVGGPDAAPIGLLPDAQLFAADVFSEDRDGAISTDDVRLASGLDWLAGQEVLAINMSLEGPNSKILEVIVRRLVEGGVAMVAAAGNNGPDAPAAFPASYSPVVAVTAVDRYQQVYAQANRGAYIDLAAPGVGIWTVDASGDGVLKDGTSFAAPFVTAGIAQLMALQPSLGPAGAAQELVRSAVDLGAPGPDATFGAGLLTAPRCAPGTDTE